MEQVKLPRHVQAVQSTFTHRFLVGSDPAIAPNEPLPGTESFELRY